MRTESYRRLGLLVCQVPSIARSSARAPSRDAWPRAVAVGSSVDPRPLQNFGETIARRAPTEDVTYAMSGSCSMLAVRRYMAAKHRSLIAPIAMDAYRAPSATLHPVRERFSFDHGGPVRD
jgi:hypothetical protein